MVTKQAGKLQPQVRSARRVDLCHHLHGQHNNATTTHLLLFIISLEITYSIPRSYASRSFTFRRYQARSCYYPKSRKTTQDLRGNNSHNPTFFTIAYARLQGARSLQVIARSISRLSQTLQDQAELCIIYVTTTAIPALTIAYEDQDTTTRPHL